MDSHEIIRRPLHTEKSVTDIQANNVYHFEVHPKATKTQIRRAVEELFPGRRVRDVRTAWVKGKWRGRMWSTHYTGKRKKALVKLRPGDSIDIGY